MGDQSNAPERIGVIVHVERNEAVGVERSDAPLLRGYRREEMVSAEAYDRAITERDHWKGRKDEAVSVRNKATHRAAVAEARADRYRADAREAVAALESDSSAEARIEAALIFLRAALAEGEQPAAAPTSNVRRLHYALALLSSIEWWARWVGSAPGECFVCGYPQARGHEAGCSLHAVLTGQTPHRLVDGERRYGDAAFGADTKGKRQFATPVVPPAAGEQSTTEPGGGDEPFKVADLVVVVDQGNSMIPEGKPGFWLKGHPVMGELVQFALGSSWVKSVARAAVAPSTTETATGHEYSLLDAVLPAGGDRRTAQVHMVVKLLVAAHARQPSLLAARILDALRSAATPASPEGPDA
jgi:hypothetical protein